MDQSAKQSIVERIKGSTNILVTVSRDPSVDELSAALALTLMLNKMDKHATAVFSGRIPSAIDFLEPGRTFENTVDSLRDFIIALDKEKADRLRYKVENDVVRIYITPYRTTITERDLQFSQGDFNVELVIALGVEKREDLDGAIAAHGRILHDATVATINDDGKKSGLGSIDWTDDSVSSLCEMLMSLSEALQNGLLDEQIASALLTGLVAATERFSNTETSPRVMTMAAQLMAAGANQQLIAAKLEEGNALPPVSKPLAPEPTTPAGVQPQEDASEKIDEESDTKAGGALLISHDEPTGLPPVQPPSIDSQLPNSAQPAPLPMATLPTLPPLPPAPGPAPSPVQPPDMSEHIVVPATPNLSVSDLQKDLAEAADELKAAAAPLTKEPPQISVAKGGWKERNIEPTFGGTLNATADEAEEAKMREELSAKNHKILNHSTFAPQDTTPSYAQEEPGSVDPFAEPPRADPNAPMHYEPTGFDAPPSMPIPVTPPAEPVSPPAPEPFPEPAPPEPPMFAPAPPPSGPTLAELEAEAKGQASGSSLDDARAAVDAALSGVPLPSAPPSIGALPPEPAPSMPPLPDFSTLPPLPSDVATPPPQQMEPPQTPHVALPPEPMPIQEPAPNDPGQFKIPGQ